MSISRWMDLKLTAEGAERGRLEAQRKLDAAQSELAALRSLKESLFPAVAHGDNAHRAWLAAAIDAHFSGSLAPGYVASGKDVELAALREEVERRAAQWQSLSHEFDNIDKRLADAERRNESLVSLILESLEAMQDLGERHGIKRCRELAQDFEQAIKPTESGASE